MIEKKKQNQPVVMFVDNEGDLSSEEVKNNYQHIREEAELEKSDSEGDDEEDGELHVSEGSSYQNEAEETSVLRNRLISFYSSVFARRF